MRSQEAIAEPRPKSLVYYRDPNDAEPCLAWLDGLRDAKGRAIIRTRLNRLESGNAGRCDPVGEDVHELKIDFGPGYRVYFGNDGDSIVLRAGGDKSSQSSDITTAKQRWREYNA